MPGHTLRWGYFWEWLVLVSERGLDSCMCVCARVGACASVCMHTRVRESFQILGGAAKA